jgi:hypothetical protein
MWVFIRPRGGQECYLLTCEITECWIFCPIHRFDWFNQILLLCLETPHNLESLLVTFSARCAWL